MMMLTPGILVALTYAGLAGLYLVVVPLAALIYINRRWETSAAWEKVILFFVALFFFPGMLLWGSFFTFRPPMREI
ncbi:MAG: NAD(P)H-quinone oxidoreductase subunit L [Cyanophyceae cyanobacterium]